MIGWRDPSMQVAGRATLCDTRAMNKFSRSAWLIDNGVALVKARRVRTDHTGRVVIAAVSTHLLAQRAVNPWWNL